MKQPPLLINLEPNSDALAISTKLSKSRKGSQLVSDISIKEEAGETNAPEGSYGSKVSTSKLQDKNTVCSKEIKVNEALLFYTLSNPKFSLFNIKNILILNFAKDTFL